MNTTTVADWPAVQAYLAEHTSGDAHVLTALTGLHDSDLHHIVVDHGTRTVWWAYDRSPLDGEGWTVEQLTPADAAEQAADQIDLIQDRQDDPQRYVEGEGDLECDQEALDEYAEILRLALPAEPAAARAQIKHRRKLLARQDALWQRAYAEMVRGLAGTERGGRTRAAQQLDVTDMQVGRIIREDDQRRARLAEAVQAARTA